MTWRDVTWCDVMWFDMIWLWYDQSNMSVCLSVCQSVILFLSLFTILKTKRNWNIIIFIRWELSVKIIFLWKLPFYVIQQKLAHAKRDWRWCFCANRRLQWCQTCLKMCYLQFGKKVKCKIIYHASKLLKREHKWKKHLCKLLNLNSFCYKTLNKLHLY